MTNNLDRRVAKLEAASLAEKAGGETRVAFVRPGEDRDEQIAKVGPLRPGDHLIVVNFIRPADVQSPSTLQ